ncbi:MAG TPA: putative lipid II flippase FtsW [Nitrospinota bacterium]|nr:putative lipid II flippase FtsW [Anaerolineaceae bacterium]HJM83584.1 putative lipid II flippase FtsW [Nitrospinota bacterium]|tara:strand:- start:13182 stop:14294 length:1113 start_codon:yes stop_codon:yes gene_type:complete
MSIKRKPDYWIMVCSIALLAIGIAMIFSSSAMIAEEKFHDPFYFLKKQALWAAIGITLMLIASRIDYRIYKKYTYVLYAIAIIGLALVFIPGLGVTLNGARRWIDIGFVTLQPSEFTKLALFIFFAGFLSKKEKEGKLDSLPFGFIPNLLALAIVFTLIQMQPDLGTALIIVLVAFFMFLAAGMRILFLVTTALLAFPLVAMSIVTVAYRKKRLMSFIDPWRDSTDSGYQIIQSFVALSNGGISGVGLGSSQQKLFFLPEPHTDFIFSILGEELGLIGGLVVISLFAVLTWRGLRVGLLVEDSFGRLLALGITFAISIQAIINMAVAMGMLPTKGLPLPFISLGGSALIMWMISIGILSNISEHSKLKGK